VHLPAAMTFEIDAALSWAKLVTIAFPPGRDRGVTHATLDAMCDERHGSCGDRLERAVRTPVVTRVEKISLLHELVEHAIGHRGLREELHELVREIGPDQDGRRSSTSSSGPRMKLLDHTSSCSTSSVAG
jgi:hypothetical protein